VAGGGRGRRTYTRDGRGRFASTGTTTAKAKPAARRAQRGTNRLTRDNSGRITGAGKNGATARGGRLRTAAGNQRGAVLDRMKRAPMAGTVGKKRGKLSTSKMKKMSSYSRVAASGQDLARRWARAGGAARRRGIESYAGPPSRKKAERAAVVDAAARGFRGAMAGAPGLRYANAMKQQDTQQKAEASFRARPVFSTKQKTRKNWI